MNTNFNKINAILSRRLKNAGISSVIACCATYYNRYEFSVVDIKRSLHIIALDIERPEVAYDDVLKAIINRILSKYAN